MDSAAPHSQEALANKSKVLNRLRRLEGQVRGLHRMVEQERDCREILTLLASVRSALDAAGDLIFESYLSDCQARLSAGQGDVQALTEAIRLVRR